MSDPNPTPDPDPIPDPTPDPEPRTFSQEDLNRIVAERVARVKATPPADYDDLKAAAQKLAELEAANQTELERAQERATKAEADAQKAVERAKDTALRSAIISEAAKKNVIDPDAAVALIDRSTLEFDDDGSPTNTADAVEALLKAKPYLVGGGTREGADQGARGGGKNQLGANATKGMTPEEIRQATREGRFDKELGRV